MKDNILNEFLSKSKIIPYIMYFIFNDFYGISSEITKIFQKIDEIVMMKGLTLKFEVHNRLKLSLMNKDYEELK